MNILVAYDVNTETKEGQKRLRQIAKACEGYGQRVQHSVFECSIAAIEMEQLRVRLLGIMDVRLDSLRIYRLHPQREEVVEVHGRDLYRDFSAPLVI